MPINTLNFYYIVDSFYLQQNIRYLSLIMQSLNMKRLLIIAAMLIQLIIAVKIDTTIQTLSAVDLKIRVIYPSQQIKSTEKIYLRGDNCNLNWNKGIILTKDTNSSNIWSTMLSCPANIKLNAKALIDDKTWMIGINAQFTTLENVTNLFDIYPSFYPQIVPLQNYSRIHSNILKNTRNMTIYLPPSFRDNYLKQYEVLIMHDGQNLFDPRLAAFGVAWQCQDTLNKLILKGDMKEILVVGVWNTANRNNEYTYSYDPSYKFGGDGDKYLDFLQSQLIPSLNTQFLSGRVISINGFAIGGSSLGGLISCYATYTRPKTFTKGICMSSSFWWNSEDFNNIVLKNNSYVDKIKLYLDSGDSGPSQDSKNQTLRVLDHFKKIGYEMNETLFYYLDKGGQHSEAYWGKRFYIPLQQLFS